jgi:hypothetical protein
MTTEEARRQLQAQVGESVFITQDMRCPQCGQSFCGAGVRVVTAILGASDLSFCTDVDLAICVKCSDQLTREQVHEIVTRLIAEWRLSRVGKGGAA